LPIADPVLIRLAEPPGTELAAIITRFAAWLPWLDLAKHDGCGCDDLARQMDEMGPDECERHLDYLVDRLPSQAKARRLAVPFRRTAAATLVRLAIRRARLRSATADQRDAP
jgi:hypothetical protein